MENQLTTGTLELDAALKKVRTQVETFLNDTESARVASERDRDYVDHKQWSAEEITKLTGRNQAPIVVNRIKPKVEGLKGLVSIRNSDPKAYPRTKKHNKAAEAITDALRYVCDDNDFNNGAKMQVVDDFFVEGTAGAIVDVRQGPRGIDIRIDEIPWDRIFFDPHSRKKDFSDARFKGLILWMDKEEVQEKFPDADIDALLAGGEDGGTFDDRPKWLDSGKSRIRIAMHFYKEKGKWMFCIHAGHGFLVEPQESPYLDEDGVPTCPIELVCAYIDRENNRYGEVRGFIDQQDEINHRRSKFLHLLSQRQTKSAKGAVKDLKKLQRELAKPNGHIEIEGAMEDFAILETGDMAQGQITLYQDAKAELDSVSFNAQLAGERQQGDLSGKAIEKLQAAGTVELNTLFVLLNGWEKRIYRQVWARIKQFWTEEKWIRVTDDHDQLRWVGLNSEITAQEFLEETINDKSQPLFKRKQAAATFKMLMDAAGGDDPQQAQQAQEVLDKPVGVTNEVAEIDVDIIIDQSFDTINVQQEQFELIAKFAGNSADIDIIELIELSQIRGKDDLVKKIEERRKAQAEAQGGVANAQAESLKAKSFVDMTKGELNKQSAIEKQIKNTLTIANPNRDLIAANGR